MTAMVELTDANPKLHSIAEEHATDQHYSSFMKDPEKAPDIQLQTLIQLAKRPAVDIEFDDLSYTVRNSSSTSGRRNILKSLNGKFQSGHLTAILGPSGAGKTTLMNILAGYVTAGVTGTIQTNGHPRQMRLFQKLSTYIMQEDLLQPLLTVEELMHIATELKLGNELTGKQKHEVVNEILQTLSLESCRKTRTEKISGGQRKRLSIAVELVNNPPVIFLDEPTTGLDICAIKQCLHMLKLLARQGRTIVCTIHQPTASHFKLFDHVYVLGRGQCVYQGPAPQLVPFLSSVGLECPKTHNPADFVMEIVQGDTADTIKTLSEEIERRKHELIRDHRRAIGRLGRPTELCHQETLMVMPPVYNQSLANSKYSGVEFPTSCIKQFTILTRRMTTQSTRNTIAIWIQLLHHVLSGFMIGLIYIGTGNNADKPFTSFKITLAILVFFMYTHVMTPVLLFPGEVKILRREYFNRWYGLKAYYLAASVSTLPCMIILGLTFNVIVYGMSGQPLDVLRFTKFSLICLLIAIVSEGYGMIVGSVFSIVNGSIVAPASFSPLLALSVYGVGHGLTIEPIMKALMNMSYLRYGLTGISVAIYGDHRAPLQCSEVDDFSYCHYKNPDMLLRDLGMADTSVTYEALLLIVFLVFYRFVAYLALRYRLTVEFSNRLLSYVSKILRHKG